MQPRKSRLYFFKLFPADVFRRFKKDSTRGTRARVRQNGTLKKSVIRQAANTKGTQNCFAVLGVSIGSESDNKIPKNGFFKSDDGASSDFKQVCVRTPSTPDNSWFSSSWHAVANRNANRARILGPLGSSSFRSFRLFELPTKADTGTYPAVGLCFFSSIKPKV